MDPELAHTVRSRARDTCEYCLLPQSVRRLRFQIEHIIARQHGGASTVDNLALACGRCNRHKGTNIAGIDPLTSQMTRLFNPRTDRWSEHFRWEGPHAVGLTAIGRTAIEVLALNHPDETALRLELTESNRFPPIPPA
jgi:HNH endonuclease